MMKTVRNFGFSNRPMIILLKNQPTVSINGINLYNHIRQSERRSRQDNAVRPFRKLPCVKGAQRDRVRHRSAAVHRQETDRKSVV